MAKINKTNTMVSYSIEKDNAEYAVRINTNHETGKDEWTILDSDGNDVADVDLVEEMVFLVEAYINYEIINKHDFHNN